MYSKRDPAALSEFAKRISDELNIGPDVILPAREITCLSLEDRKALKADYPFRYEVVRDALGKELHEAFPEADREGLRTKLHIAGKLDLFRQGLADGSVTTALQSRPKQLVSLEAIHKVLEAGKDRAFLEVCTGYGKTVLSAVTCQAVDLPSIGQKTLVVMPMKSLIPQWERAIAKHTNQTSSTYYSEGKSLEGDIILTTYASLPKVVAEADKAGIRFGMVIADEAHRSLTPRLQTTLNQVPGSPFYLALSATGDFNEIKGVRHFFGAPCHKVPVTEGIEEGLLTGARWIGLRTNTDISNVKINQNGNFNEASFEKSVNIAARDEVILQVLQSSAMKGLSTAVYLTSISRVNNFIEKAKERGIEIAVDHSEMSDADRIANRARYESGQAKVMVSVDALAEGWDSPRTKALIIDRATTSPVMAGQRPGRGLRLWEEGDKKYCLIFELVDPFKAKKADGDRPILVPDVLGGAMVLPKAMAKDTGFIEESDKFIREIQDSITVEGISVISDVVAFAEFMQGREEVLSNVEQDPSLHAISTIEKIRTILDRNEITPEVIASQKKSEWLSKFLIDGNFYGTFRSLILQYHRNVKGDASFSISNDKVLEFCGEIFGHEKMNEALRKSASRTCAKSRLEANLLETRRIPYPEVLDEKLPARISYIEPPSRFTRGKEPTWSRSDIVVDVTFRELIEGTLSRLGKNPGDLNNQQEYLKALKVVAEEAFGSENKTKKFVTLYREDQNISIFERSGELDVELKKINHFEAITLADFNKLIVSGFLGESITAYYDIHDENSFNAFKNQILGKEGLENEVVVVQSSEEDQTNSYEPSSNLLQYLTCKYENPQGIIQKLAAARTPIPGEFSETITLEGTLGKINKAGFEDTLSLMEQLNGVTQEGTKIERLVTLARSTQSAIPDLLALDYFTLYLTKGDEAFDSKLGNLIRSVEDPWLTNKQILERNVELGGLSVKLNDLIYHYRRHGKPDERTRDELLTTLGSPEFIDERIRIRTLGVRTLIDEMKADPSLSDAKKLSSKEYLIEGKKILGHKLLEFISDDGKEPWNVPYQVREYPRKYLMDYLIGESGKS